MNKEQKTKTKTSFDEQALGRVLEAAYVLQEHKGALPVSPQGASQADPENGRHGQKISDAERLSTTAPEAAKPETVKSDTPKFEASQSKPTSSSSAAALSAIATSTTVNSASDGATPVGSKEESSTLAQIAETQRQIQSRHLDLESTFDLVAGRAVEITRASGAAVALADDHKVSYRAAVGAGVLPRGSEVVEEKALCAATLRSCEITRVHDVTADPAIDSAECRRRGIAALFIVPILRAGAAAGALEIYFDAARTIADADVHTAQLLAGLAAEALVREAQAASQRSLAAERASMLAALEKLQPNLAALVEAAPASYAAANNKTADAVPPKAAALAPDFTCRKCSHELVAGEQFCGKCGTARSADYEAPNMQSKVATLWLMQQGEKDKNDKRSAAAAAAEGTASSSRVEARAATKRPVTHSATPVTDFLLPDFEADQAEITPAKITPKESKSNLYSDEAEGDDLPDLFEMPEIKKALADLEDARTPAPFARPLPAATQSTASLVQDIPGKDKLLDHPALPPAIDSPASSPIDSRSLDSEILPAGLQKEVQEKVDEIDLVAQEDELARALAADELAEKTPGKNGNSAAAKIKPGEENSANGAASTETALVKSEAADANLATNISWTSAAEARNVLERLAGTSRRNAFLRFWNTRRGDVYLAVAVVLVAGVIRWGITSSRTASANAAQAAAHHGKADPNANANTNSNADLSLFDRMLVAVGLAEAPEHPIEYKGNPDTKVWVDTHTALYYCAGDDLYGKTPQGRETTQRDAQLDQFEPASRRACE